MPESRATAWLIQNSKRFQWKYSMNPKYSSFLHTALILAILLALLPTQPARAYGPKVWYVRPNGSDAAGVCSGLSNQDAGSHPNCARASLENALALAANGDIINVNNSSNAYAKSIYGAITINKAVQIILAAEFSLTQTKTRSPCFIISASHVRIISETNHASCVSGAHAEAIVVQSGISDLTISGLQLNGDDSADTGILFSGAINNLQIVNNAFRGFSNEHDLTFTVVPSGVVDIQGNGFESTENGAVYLPSSNSIDLRNNSWGSSSGPGQDDISAMHSSLGSAAYSPYTYANLYLRFDADHNQTQSAYSGETISATVLTSAVGLSGVDCVLIFPTNMLNYESANLSGSAFGAEAGIDSDATAINASGRIRFHGLANQPAGVTSSAALLYTVTFTTTGNDQEGTLGFDASSDAFSMAAGYGPSNTIRGKLSNRNLTVYSDSGVVTGTVLMQGRLSHSGAAVTLEGTNIKTGITSNRLSNNLAIFDVKLNNRHVLTIQIPGYLSVLSDNHKGMDTKSKRTIKFLEMRGGDANEDNNINIQDANLIAADYGSSGTDEYQNGIHIFTDINASGRVDILDLALMAGNYTVNSIQAYGIENTDTWDPED